MISDMTLAILRIRMIDLDQDGTIVPHQRTVDAVATMAGELLAARNLIAEYETYRSSGDVSREAMIEALDIAERAYAEARK